MHTREQGIDTRVGKISKPKGMTIGYDIGPLAGNYADGTRKDGKCAWFKKQKVNQQECQICLEKNGYIYATFPADYASFMGQTKSPEDVADFLIMILTYGTKETVRQDKTK